MKKVLIDKNLNWYRANLHCHSTHSDGHFTPEQLKEVYKKEGYQILAISDHEILLDHSDLNDENFLTLTSTEYSINADEESFPALDKTKKIDPWIRKKLMHLNAFSPDPHNTFQPAAKTAEWYGMNGDYPESKFDGYERKYTKESLNETIRRLNEHGFLVQFNHPNWSVNEREDYMALEGLWSLEILNHATEVLTGAEYCPYIYDDMLRNGKKLFCTMGDDNHNRKKPDGTYDMTQSFGGFTMIGANELKYDKIFDAMKNGNFYCSMGPRIHSLIVEDNKVKIDCSPVKNIILTGYGRHFQNIKGDYLTHAEFDISKCEGYFRITARDGQNRSAHTNAYWINEVQK